MLHGELSKTLAPRRVEVVNGGVPGYSSLQVSLFLSERCFALEPDLITLCVGVNDAFLIPEFYSSDSELYVPWRRAAHKAKLFLGRSRLFTLLDTLTQRVVRRLSASDHREGEGRNMKPRVTLDGYRGYLTEIADECESRDIPLIMFSFSLPDAYASMMRSVAKQAGATFLDIEPLLDRMVQALKTSSVRLLSASQATVSASRGRIFAGVYESIFSEAMLKTHTNPALFIDPCHPTAVGHEVIASALAEAIVKEIAER